MNRVENDSALSPCSIGYRQTGVKHLLTFFGDTPLSKIARADIEKFIQQEVDEDAAPSSINRHRAVLSKIFDKAEDGRLASLNPVTKTPFLKQNNLSPGPLTPDEESILFAVLPPHIEPGIETSPPQSVISRSTSPA